MLRKCSENGLEWEGERRYNFGMNRGTFFGVGLLLLPIIIEAPPDCRFQINGNPVASEIAWGKYALSPSFELLFPLKLEVNGPFGGLITRLIPTAPQLNQLKISEGIIVGKEANPRTLAVLPTLCPRLEKGRNGYHYDGTEDRFNHTPLFQMMDPDIKTGKQKLTYSEMDGKNVLLLNRARVTNDYEDTGIVDYDGPHPLTGRPQRIHEGDGGFYANFHYAIIPYQKEVTTMDRQTLLHLAQGKLSEIDKQNVAPELRVHSFIPGPFLSKPDRLYPLCEWGDTAHQSPDQALNYTEMALWDWDYPVKNPGHLLMIVWEGDEEDWLIRKELIHPFYLTDDLVGVFEIKKQETAKTLTLKNAKGDFEITVITGNLDTPPR
ncbi:MAG: hypothetical protein Q7T11_09005 [Deltaproteobacteria bacterium]|nr:hypothetical protein [Deltaproteobacteria bacterium]